MASRSRWTCKLGWRKQYCPQPCRSCLCGQLSWSTCYNSIKTDCLWPELPETVFAQLHDEVETFILEPFLPGIFVPRIIAQAKLGLECYPARLLECEQLPVKHAAAFKKLVLSTLK